MTTLPAISVVIPTYNSAPYVVATIDSVLAQTFTDFELVIGDHGSTDDTWQILQRYRTEPRVRLLQTEPGGGAQRNWNRVTEAARADLMKLVCADDLLRPTALADQRAALMRYPAATMAASSRDIVDAHGEVLVSDRGLRGLTGLVPGGQAVRATVRAGTNIFGEPACVMMRRADVEAVGGWSPTAEYLIDLDMYYRLLRRGDLIVVPGPLAAFRVSLSQWSVALTREQARQTSSFHRQVQVEWPTAVSRADVRVGDARGALNAIGRRAAYQWWARRLVP